MDDSDIKVTDKRMFTPDGELRAEFRGEDESEAPTAAPQAPPSAPESPAPEPVPAAPRLEIPGGLGGLGAPTFLDLLASLADPIWLYLGDLALPDGTSAENLELARLHIDLLDLLRQKTRGNLSSQELAVLEDLLYRARLRYVQKRG